MSLFGDGTNKGREAIYDGDVFKGISNTILDSGKTKYQTSLASVVSFAPKLTEEEPNETRYIVFLIREQKEIEATLSKNYRSWSQWLKPVSGDIVKIQHREDYYEAEIISKAELDSSHDKIFKIEKALVKCN